MPRESTSLYIDILFTNQTCDSHIKIKIWLFPPKTSDLKICKSHIDCLKKKKKKTENKNLKRSEMCLKYVNQVCSTTSVLLFLEPIHT